MFSKFALALLATSTVAYHLQSNQYNDYYDPYGTSSQSDYYGLPSSQQQGTPISQQPSYRPTRPTRPTINFGRRATTTVDDAPNRATYQSKPQDPYAFNNDQFFSDLGHLRSRRNGNDPNGAHTHTPPADLDAVDNADEGAEDTSNLTSHNDNIWNPHDGNHNDPVLQDDWYSPTQQYSPVKIPFVPHAKYPSFAICKYQTTTGSAEIQIGQVPGQGSMIRGEVIEQQLALIKPYFRINKLGRLMTDTAAMCSAEATGKEFNPLTEFNMYGQPNPFQDPTRGRIDSCIFEVDANDATAVSCKIGKSAEDGQDVLMQNTDDLIGKSITVFTLDPFTSAEIALGCCIIGKDEIPSHYSAGHENHSGQHSH